MFIERFKIQIQIHQAISLAKKAKPETIDAALTKIREASERLDRFNKKHTLFSRIFRWIDRHFAFNPLKTQSNKLQALARKTQQLAQKNLPVTPPAYPVTAARKPYTSESSSSSSSSSSSLSSSSRSLLDLDAEPLPEEAGLEEEIKEFQVINPDPTEQKPSEESDEELMPDPTPKDEDPFIDFPETTYAPLDPNDDPLADLPAQSDSEETEEERSSQEELLPQNPPTSPLEPKPEAAEDQVAPLNAFIAEFEVDTQDIEEFNPWLETYNALNAAEKERFLKALRHYWENDGSKVNKTDSFRGILSKSDEFVSVVENYYLKRDGLSGDDHDKLLIEHLPSMIESYIFLDDPLWGQILDAFERTLDKDEQVPALKLLIEAIGLALNEPEDAQKFNALNTLYIDYIDPNGLPDPQGHVEPDDSDSDSEVSADAIETVDSESPPLHFSLEDFIKDHQIDTSSIPQFGDFETRFKAWDADTQWLFLEALELHWGTNGQDLDKSVSLDGILHNEAAFMNAMERLKTMKDLPEDAQRKILIQALPDLIASSIFADRPLWDVILSALTLELGNTEISATDREAMRKQMVQLGEQLDDNDPQLGELQEVYQFIFREKLPSEEASDSMEGMILSGP